MTFIGVITQERNVVSVLKLELKKKNGLGTYYIYIMNLEQERINKKVITEDISKIIC